MHKKLEVNNNQLLIEMKKKKQEMVALKNSLDKGKKNTSNNKGMTRECFEGKERKKKLSQRIGRHEVSKNELKTEANEHQKKGRQLNMSMTGAERKLIKELADEIEEMRKDLKMQKKICKLPHVDVCGFFGSEMWMLM